VVEGGSGRGQFRRRSSAVAAAVTPSWIGTGAPRATPDPWLRQWLDADAVARKVVAEVLGDAVSGPVVARAVASVVPQDGLLFVGSSASIRDLDIADPWDEPPLVLANRGVAGIDGTVSTALGAALAHDGDAFALLGDLTFLHDSNGLVLGADEPRPALTFVVNNDDGGGIFGQLEQGAPEHAAVFERVFGTPHGVDIASLCAATATPHELVTSEAALRDALAARRSGIRVVEVRTDRSRRRDLDRRMRDGVTAATTTLRNG
jgi:2-succinyl-5-enolpyruvyl-6-hydroxy-3-cyclohexene-1-carboxylate synthase